MLKTSVKNLMAGLGGTFRRFMGLDIALNDKLPFFVTLFQYLLIFLIFIAVVIFVALPRDVSNTSLTDNIIAGFIMIGSIGYFILSRIVLRTITREISAHGQFISDASHELKTPLTIMKTRLEVALKYYEKDDHVETFNDVLQEVNRMQKIVENLLSLSKSDNKRVSTEKVEHINLNKLLDEVVRKIRPYAETRKIKLIFPEGLSRLKPSMVNGDWLRLTEVFLNIIENSIVYSKSGGGNVEITITRPHDSKFAVIKIRDDGIGIGKEHLPFIFKRFYQIDKSKALREGGGSGLGLAISKSIVQDYGGKIEIESQYGKGTSVIISLVLSKPKTQKEG